MSNRLSMVDLSQAAEVSVIIPAYHADTTLPLVLDALRSQIDDHIEVLVLESSSRPYASELQRSYAWAKIISLEERTLPGRARNLGVEVATASVLAFLDADTVPGPEWLCSLRRGLLDTRYCAVGGAVLNGTPRSAVGTAFYLLEFLDWSPYRTGALRHAASCNLMVRRTALVDAGGFPEDVWPGEDTILTYRWGAAAWDSFAMRRCGT